MRVAIFGATGGVGRWLLAIARENEDHVKILVRDPSALPQDLGAIGVVRGDVLDPEAVETAIGGCDVVFSALGARGRSKANVCSRGLANVIAAMRREGCTRLLALSCAEVEPDPSAGSSALRLVTSLFRRGERADLAAMEAAIQKSGLAWTIVRPGRLKDGPRTGLYRANERFAPHRGSEISRADVADFMHRVIADERTIRKIAALSY